MSPLNFLHDLFDLLARPLQYLCDLLEELVPKPKTRAGEIALLMFYGFIVIAAAAYFYVEFFGNQSPLAVMKSVYWKLRAKF